MTTAPGAIKLDLTDEFDRRVRRLRNYVVRSQRSGHGVILFAVWRHVEIRKLAASALQEMLESERFSVTSIDAGEAPEGGFIDHLVDAVHGPCDVLFIFDLGRTGQDGLNALNYQREVFVEHPLLAVFWVREPELNAIAASAPDFWAFRNRVVEFPEVPDQPRFENLAEQLHGDTTYGSVEELRAKLALRNSLLQELLEDASSTRARLLNETGDMYYFLGEVDRAIERHLQALTISREIGYRRGEGSAMGSLGNDYSGLGEADKAVEYHQQALAISRQIGDRRAEGADLGNLGIAYAGLGDVDKAIELLQQGLTIAREIGNRRTEGSHLGNLGVAFTALGEVDRAVEHLQQALTISRETGNRRGEGADIGNLGNAYAELGEVDRAVEYLHQALAIAREIDDRRNEGSHLRSLGTLYIELDDRENALRHFLQAWVAFRAIGSPTVGLAIRDIARLREKVGEAQFSVMSEKATEELGVEISLEETNESDP